MKFLKNLFFELYYTFKFNNHIAKVFNKKNENQKKSVIIIETHRMYGSHIGLSYICDKLIKKYSCRVCLFKSNFFDNIFEKIFHILAMKLNLFHYKVYDSFGDTSFLYYKKTLNPYSKYEKYLKKIKTNNNLQNFKIEGILYGDLIYDSFLRWSDNYTVNLKDPHFVNFFYKSIDYYFYCKSLFEKHDIKSVILSHTVYLPAILGRIALSKGKLFFCLSITHCINLSEDYFYISNHKLNKKLFSKLPKKIQNIQIKTAKKDLIKNLKGSASEGLENLDHSPFSGVVDKSVIKKNSKIKVLVASHCFTDSPHAEGNFFFCDYYEWIEYLGKISLKTDYDWYIKPHPNKFHEKRNIEIIKNFIKKYNKFKMISNGTSHFSYINNIDYFLTIDGHIAEELAMFNKPVIFSKMDGKFSNYNFNINPKNKKEYHKILMKFKKKKKFKVDKEEIYKAHCVNHFFINQNYLVKYNKVAKKIGHDNLNSFKILKYWLDNFNLSNHNEIVKKVSNFVDRSEKEKTYTRLH